MQSETCLSNDTYNEPNWPTVACSAVSTSALCIALLSSSCCNRLGVVDTAAAAVVVLEAATRHRLEKDERKRGAALLLLLLLRTARGKHLQRTDQPIGRQPACGNILAGEPNYLRYCRARSASARARACYDDDAVTAAASVATTTTTEMKRRNERTNWRMERTN